MTDRNCILVATVKDEGPYLLEWLAYHKVIGFQKAIVFHNDCTDYTDQILRVMHRFTDFVRQFDNTVKQKGQRLDPQRRAYQRALTVKDVQHADYVLVADADEFMTIKAGAGHLDDLFDAVGEMDVFTMTWRMFGNNGVQNITGDMVTEQFQTARLDNWPKAFRLWGAKSFFRMKDVKKFGVHRPYHIPEIREGEHDIKWINGSGEDILSALRNRGWRVNRKTHGAKFAEMNHYAVRSADAFLVKQQRGSANAGDRVRLDLDYFDLYNCNDVVEDGITRHIPAIKAQVQDWLNTVPGLAQVQAESLKIHQTIAAQRRADMAKEDPAALERLDIMAK